MSKKISKLKEQKKVRLSKKKVNTGTKRSSKLNKFLIVFFYLNITIFFLFAVYGGYSFGLSKDIIWNTLSQANSGLIIGTRGKFLNSDQLVDLVFDSCTLTEEYIKDHNLTKPQITLNQVKCTNAIFSGFFNYTKQSGSLKPTEMFLEGKMNCLSSSVFYSAVFDRMGIEYRIVSIPRHVFVLVVNDALITDDYETIKWRYIVVDMEQLQVM